jgi:very-short-patch-repair endonuclease
VGRLPVARAALFDAMRTAPSLTEAVVAMDMAAAAELVSVARMRRYVATRAGWTGVRLVRRALDLVDENSLSPSETRLRLLWQREARLPRPLVNPRVWDQHGRLLGRADLLDPVAGVVGEYDGADHRSAARHSADVDREARFRDCGLEVFRVTGPDMAHPRRIVERLLSARRRARWSSPGDRAWTLEPPPAWPVERTLDDDLDERDARAALYASYERAGDPDIRARHDSVPNAP